MEVSNPIESYAGFKGLRIKRKTKQTDEMEIVISHAQGRVLRGLPGDQVSNGHDVDYVHMLSREGMLGTWGGGELYT